MTIFAARCTDAGQTYSPCGVIRASHGATCLLTTADDRPYDSSRIR